MDLSLRTAQAVVARDSVEAPLTHAPGVQLVDAVALRAHASALDELARAAVEPNVFYESWMLAPALQAFGDARMRVALVFVRPEGAHHSVLAGCVPLERGTKRVTFASWRAWKYPYCFLQTPLVRRGCADAVADALACWLKRESGVDMLELPDMGEGAVIQALVERFPQNGAPFVFDGARTRALFKPVGDADAYVREALSTKRRKELRRLERRLGELGKLEYTELAADGDVDAWIEAFLRVEASGWKGREGTAIGCLDAHARFFREVIREAHRRGRLMMLALSVGGQPVAMKCNLLAAAGGFAFKIAFDERYQAYSPGVLLEIRNIQELYRRGDVVWMDSCAASEHFMINRLWPDRRLLQTVRAAANGRGQLLIAASPLLRLMRGRLRAIFNHDTSQNHDGHCNRVSDD